MEAETAAFLWFIAFFLQGEVGNVEIEEHLVLRGGLDKEHKIAYSLEGACI